MKFIFLTEDFFNRHSSSEFPEMLRKSDRPYVQLTIPCNHKLWAVPLRSYINHEFAFWSNKKELCGLDFTKAVPIELKDIDTTHSPIIERFDELVFVKLNKQNDTLLIYFTGINNISLGNIYVNATETVLEQQQAGRRPRLNIEDKIIRPFNIQPSFLFDLRKRTFTRL